MAMITGATGSLLLLVCCGGCAERFGANATCQWTREEADPSQDLKNPSQRHLNDDALAAEDLAIRYADAHRGGRSGQFQGADEYQRARDECMATLFGVIANDHGVALAQVREALGHRRKAPDWAVIVSFFLLYGFAVSGVAGRISRSFQSEGAWPLVAATLVTSGPVSVVGALLGGLWSAAFEMIRIGNDHLSYRVSRIPWGQHQVALLVACVIVYWLMVVLRYRLDRHDSGDPGPRP